MKRKLLGIAWAFVALWSLLEAGCQCGPSSNSAADFRAEIGYEELAQALELSGSTNYEAELKALLSSKQWQEWMKAEHYTVRLEKLKAKIEVELSPNDVYLLAVLHSLSRTNHYYKEINAKLGHCVGKPPRISMKHEVVYLTWGAGLGHYGLLVRLQDASQVDERLSLTEWDQSIEFFSVGF